MASRLLTVLSNSPTHHCDEGRRHALTAIVEQALVDEGEQRVENGAVGLSVPEVRIGVSCLYAIALKHEQRRISP